MNNLTDTEKSIIADAPIFKMDALHEADKAVSTLAAMTAIDAEIRDMEEIITKL